VRATWLAPLVLGAVTGIAVADSDSGLPMWFRLRDDVAEAAERVQVLAQRNANLRSQIEALESEPFALERAIREDLGLARPGEVVVRFDRGRRDPKQEHN
jgi:cell division protein FtsB